jgi:hypothetical protein
VGLARTVNACQQVFGCLLCGFGQYLDRRNRRDRFATRNVACPTGITAPRGTGFGVAATTLNRSRGRLVATQRSRQQLPDPDANQKPSGVIAEPATTTASLAWNNGATAAIQPLRPAP